MKELGVYIHIPFCKQKCYYCDFVSFPNQEELQKEYFKALKKEISEFFTKNNQYKISTIYIGGGTPSFVEAYFIKDILKQIPNNTANEITIEINPGTVNKEKLEIYRESGINRLSIGLQSTNNELLKQIGRIHNFEDFLKTYNLAREIGFNNINVDLMIGFPNQKITDIKDSLEKIIDLGPEHISVYSLIVEENTKLYDQIETGKLILPSEEEERNMYWYVKNYLELNGFNHYEISNFSKRGFESKHNMDCWKQKEYIGFGLAAHSYIDGIRFSNTTNLQKYCEIENFYESRIIQEEQNDFAKKQEFMLLGLRLIDGVNIGKFKEKFGENPIFVFKKEFARLVEQGLINIDGNTIKLTNRGIDLANIVWEKFVT